MVDFCNEKSISRRWKQRFRYWYVSIVDIMGTKMLKQNHPCVLIFSMLLCYNAKNFIYVRDFFGLNLIKKFLLVLQVKKFCWRCNVWIDKKIRNRISIISISIFDTFSSIDIDIRYSFKIWKNIDISDTQFLG